MQNNQLTTNAFSVAFRTAAPIILAAICQGIGYGIYMRSFGFGAIWPICMAAGIFAASMEFITVGLLLGGFEPLYAFLLTLIVNGRHLFYGIAMLEKYRGGGWKKMFLVSGLIDEVFSLNYTSQPPQGIDRQKYMLIITLMIYFSWVAGTSIGAITMTTALTEVKGMGFMMTSLFVVIFISGCQKEKSHGSSLLGVAAAALCLPIFGKAYFMLPSLIIVAIIFSIRWFTSKDKTKLA